MHVSDKERQELINLILQLRELAQNERQSGDLRRQQNAVKARFIGHAEAYEDAAKRLALILGEPEGNKASAKASDAKMLGDGATIDNEADEEE